MNASEFVGYLQGVKRVREGQWLCRCPAHQDKSPSLSVCEGDGGKVLIHCFAGCDPELIAIAAGVKFSDLFPQEFTGTTSGKRRPPLDSCANILASQAIVLLVLAADLEAGRMSKPDLVKAIHKIDEVRRALR